MTSLYGDVYLRASASSLYRSFAVRLTMYGLLLGIELHLRCRAESMQFGLMAYQKYVTVFMEPCTKVSAISRRVGTQDSSTRG